MSEPFLPRRLFLKMTALLALGTGAARAGEPRPLDQGVGGTGLSLKIGGGEPDQGIGGTGVFGRIQRFGSIYVNGIRIRYPKTVAVFMDGRRVTAGAMRVGHVVRVKLDGPGESPQTGRIDITSEVVGPIEQLGKGTIKVLSQTVELGWATGLPRLRKGMIVAVFGLRTRDGRVVASRVESRPRGTGFLVRGVAEQAGRHMRIGGLTIARPAGAFRGHRVEARIGQGAQGLKLSRIETERLVPGLSSGRVSVETLGRVEDAMAGDRPSPPPASTYNVMSVGPGGRSPAFEGGERTPPGNGERGRGPGEEGRPGPRGGRPEGGGGGHPGEAGRGERGPGGGSFGGGPP